MMAILEGMIFDIEQYEESQKEKEDEDVHR